MRCSRAPSKIIIAVVACTSFNSKVSTEPPCTAVHNLDMCLADATADLSSDDAIANLALTNAQDARKAASCVTNAVEPKIKIADGR